VTKLYLGFLILISSYAVATEKHKATDLIVQIESLFTPHIQALAKTIEFPKNTSQDYKNKFSACLTDEISFFYSQMEPVLSKTIEPENIDFLVNGFKADTSNALLKLIKQEIKPEQLSKIEIERVNRLGSTNAFQQFLQFTQELGQHSTQIGLDFCNYCKSIANKSLKQDK
jgi:hypothetical protein